MKEKGRGRAPPDEDQLHELPQPQSGPQLQFSHVQFGLHKPDALIDVSMFFIFLLLNNYSTKLIRQVRVGLTLLRGRCI
jgi:hypothetical protein